MDCAYAPGECTLRSASLSLAYLSVPCLPGCPHWCPRTSAKDYSMVDCRTCGVPVALPVLVRWRTTRQAWGLERRLVLGNGNVRSRPRRDCLSTPSNRLVHACLCVPIFVLGCLVGCPLLQQLVDEPRKQTVSKTPAVQPLNPAGIAASQRLSGARGPIHPIYQPCKPVERLHLLGVTSQLRSARTMPRPRFW